MKHFFTKIVLHTHTYTHTKYVHGIQYRSHYDLHTLFPKPFQYGEFVKNIRSVIMCDPGEHFATLLIYNVQSEQQQRLTSHCYMGYIHVTQH